MINALQQGDPIAFKQVYTQYCNQVFCYFKKKTSSDEDAQDLLQTTFLKLWQYRKSLSEHYLIEQHLFHIAKTVFIDYLRRQNKQASLQKELLANRETVCCNNPSASYSLASQLAAALCVMPDIRRKVFELNRLQGYSYKEVAQLLSISVKAVDNNLTKALQQLRNQVMLSLFFLLFLSL